MNKVILTQEQAEAIKYLRKDACMSNHVIIRNLVYYDVTGVSGIEGYKNLEGIDLDKLIRALYFGYEVEPEFKVGDWVVTKVTNHIGKITGFSNITNYYDIEGIQTDHIRHATPSEIAEEKERRFWKKHGRDVWELREGDILISKTVKYPEFVTYVNGLGVHFLGGNYETWATLKKGYEIVCFAEDRKDLK